MAQEKAQIVIRRVKKVSGGGHHGGAWKVAYADFVTAMMAFFLVMWLVGSTTNKQRAAISEYFKQSSPVPGNSVSPNQGPNGPGGASTSMIQLGGTMELPRGDGQDIGGDTNQRKKAKDAKATEEEARAIAKAAEQKRLEELRKQLNAALENSQALAPFKDQLLIDITSEGLRIQIVDKQNRAMFDMGRAQLKPYTVDILKELAKSINQVPNRISITGHTDVTAYANEQGYTNWELSADRANAARRSLIAGGMAADKIVRVMGLSSSVLFDKQHPDSPINRRISIVVMTDAAEKAALLPEGNDEPKAAEDKPGEDKSEAVASAEAEAKPAEAGGDERARVNAVVDPKGRPEVLDKPAPPGFEGLKPSGMPPKTQSGLVSRGWTHDATPTAEAK